MDKHVFYDEEGNKVEFIINAKFSIDDTDYVAMESCDSLDNMIYILKIQSDKEGNEFLVGIDDEELNEAKQVYEELTSENEK
ncbi:MAG: DUF1292 domain-containing protein [Peptoniphilaceae bacterium]